jgi:DNA (cytosine-5)-methyltransferase 1
MKGELKIKVLNLYAGIGGNRRLWRGVEVTAIEYNDGIAQVYQDLFPDDVVIVADAHAYLLEHYQEFDFIWSSPPCPTHSQYRHNVGFRAKGFKAVYPDMKLYEEILLLQHHFSGKYVVENTVSYYDPLIKPQKVSRHYFWANFDIPDIKIQTTGIRNKNKISDLEKFLGYDLSSYKIPNKRQILRNCVNPELGLHVLMCVL